MLFGNKREKQNAQIVAPQDLKIAEDCTRLVNTTETPDVFFKRYDLLIEKAHALVGYAKYVKFKGTPPKKMLEQALEKKTAATSDFIERYHARVVIEAAGKATEKGKRAQFDKFLASMQAHAADLSLEQMKHVEELHAADIAKL